MASSAIANAFENSLSVRFAATTSGQACTSQTIKAEWSLRSPWKPAKCPSLVCSMVVAITKRSCKPTLDHSSALRNNDPGLNTRPSAQIDPLTKSFNGAAQLKTPAPPQQQTTAPTPAPQNTNAQVKKPKAF